MQNSTNILLLRKLNRLRLRNDSLFLRRLSRIISSALTLSPIKRDTTTHIKRYAGIFTFSEKTYILGSPSVPARNLMKNDNMIASMGASSMLIARYCLSLSLDKASRIANILNCFHLFGILNRLCGSASFFSRSRFSFHSNLLSKFSRYNLYHSSGLILRFLISLP